MCRSISANPQRALSTMFVIVAATTLVIMGVALAILLTPTIAIPAIFVPALIGVAAGSGLISLISAISAAILILSKTKKPLSAHNSSASTPATPQKLKSNSFLTSPDQRFVTAMQSLMTFKQSLDKNCAATKTVNYLYKTYIEQIPANPAAITKFEEELTKANKADLTAEELITIQKNISGLIHEEEGSEEEV